MGLMGLRGPKLDTSRQMWFSGKDFGATGMYAWILQVKSLEHGLGSGGLTQVLEVRLDKPHLGLSQVGRTASLRWGQWSTGMQRCSCLMRSLTPQ